MEEIKTELKCIKSARLAKKLIGMGYTVRDIKPNKGNHFASIFLFDKTEELMKIVNEWLVAEEESKFIKNWKGGLLDI